MIHLIGVRETFLDFPDNESLSVIVFTEGCSHNCPGCQNKESQIQNPETEITKEEFLQDILIRCERNQTNKVVFSGGDPLYHSGDTTEQLIEILETIDYLENHGFDCCVYTGYEFPKVKEIYETYGKELTGPKFIKCGCYREDLKDINAGKTDDCFTLASTNQYFMIKDESLFSGGPHNYVRGSKENVMFFNRPLVVLD